MLRKQNRREEDYATVFWSKLAAACAIYAGLWACSPLIASFYGVPQLVWVLRVEMLGLVVVAGSSVLLARLQASCRFRAIAVVSSVSMLLSGVVGVGMALRGLGVWAIVGQGLSWQVWTLLLLIAANRWLPKLRFSSASLLAFLSFGWKHLLRSLLGSLFDGCFAVTIGKRFGAAELGLYNRADYYTSESCGMVGGMVNDVTYPILAKLQDDDCRLWRNYCWLSVLLACFTVPAMTVFAVFAEPIVRFVIGDQWVACAPFVSYLAIGAALSPLVNLSFVPMYVKGRTDLALKLDLIIKPIGFALFVAAIPLGINAICIAKSASVILALIVGTLVVRRLLRSGR